jgi:hypothetical protein
MADQVIVFDAGQYNAVINALTTVIEGLQNITTTRAVPLSVNMKLQPDGQTWDPAVELVAAGAEFLAKKHQSIANGMLPRLTTLRDGLIAAKSIFQDTEDLATVSRADFVKDFPDLNVPTPNRLGDAW